MNQDKTRVVVVFGRVITLETLKQGCRLNRFPDGYADLLWRDYWSKKDAGQDRTGALTGMIKICFDPSERRELHGRTIEEK